MITIHIHLDKVHQIMVIHRLWWLVKKIMSTFFVFFCTAFSEINFLWHSFCLSTHAFFTTVNSYKVRSMWNLSPKTILFHGSVPLPKLVPNQ
jgi:hypothetical protein